MKTDAPRCSVITPVFNVEPYVEEAVRSVLNQSFEDFVNLKLFRLKHMSFQNEKQRKKMIDRCINI